MQDDSNSIPTLTAVNARQKIEQAAAEITRTTTAQIIALRPDIYQENTDTPVMRAHIEQQLMALAAAVVSHDPRTFQRAIEADETSARVHDLKVWIEVLGQSLRERLGDPVWNFAKPALDSALAWLTPPIESAALTQAVGPAGIAQRYTVTILAGDRVGAEQLVFDALAHGYTVRDIYLKIIQPSLYEVGRLWETGQVSIPQEHLATAVTQSVLSAIYARVELPSSLDNHAIVACLENNFHEIGPRMLADFLQMAGFNTRFLGTNTSLDCLIEMIQQVKPGVIGLPATTPGQVDSVKLAIERVRADFTTYRPTIMVGGLAFNYSDGLWKTVRADLWSADGGHAVDQLVGSSDWG